MILNRERLLHCCFYSVSLTKMEDTASVCDDTEAKGQFSMFSNEVCGKEKRLCLLLVMECIIT